ncbi:hypothetical protein BST61_g8194 [Cercospora zeina]
MSVSWGDSFRLEGWLNGSGVRASHTMDLRSLAPRPAHRRDPTDANSTPAQSQPALRASSAAPEIAKRVHGKSLDDRSH